MKHKMTLRDIARLLDAEVLTGEDKLDTEAVTACGSDLMSDVLAFVKDKTILITGACERARHSHGGDAGHHLCRLCPRQGVRARTF